MISIQLLIQEFQYITTVDRLLRGLVYCLFLIENHIKLRKMCVHKII